LHKKWGKFCGGGGPHALGVFAALESNTAASALPFNGAMFLEGMAGLKKVGRDSAVAAAERIDRAASRMSVGTNLKMDGNFLLRSLATRRAQTRFSDMESPRSESGFGSDSTEDSSPLESSIDSSFGTAGASRFSLTFGRWYVAWLVCMGQIRRNVRPPNLMRTKRIWSQKPYFECTHLIHFEVDACALVMVMLYHIQF
jgi:hypothetical protein